MTAYGPGRSIVAENTAVFSARFTPRLRVALPFGQVRTAHTLLSGALYTREAFYFAAYFSPSLWKALP